MAIAPLSAVPARAVASPAPQARASFGAALRAQRTAGAIPAPVTAAAQAARAALVSVERARDRLDAILAAARRGRTFTAQELLGLQADAYRYAQTLELASKAVEHGAQSVRQAVNTQV